jgi:hypothetical protein
MGPVKYKIKSDQWRVSQKFQSFMSKVVMFQFRHVFNNQSRISDFQGKFYDGGCKINQFTLTVRVVNIFYHGGAVKVTCLCVGGCQCQAKSIRLLLKSCSRLTRVTPPEKYKRGFSDSPFLRQHEGL